MALNAKQKRFCEEYVVDLNGTQAAIRAGYSQKTANVIAAQNLTKLSVQNYVQSLKQSAFDANKVTAQMVIDELAKLAFHNVRDFINGGNSILELKTIDKNKTAAVSGIKTILKDDGSIHTELKFHSKEKALELLGKHFGIFEKDNEQRKTEINLSNLSTEQLLQLEQILSATTGESK